ncbi:MAG: sigma-E factor negative regulatory protein [Gammaproteobacteria bacterium]
MRDDTLEQLSSFMDGELSDRDHRTLVEACVNDDDLRAKWARYHLIGTTLRSGLPETLMRSLPDRVALALDHEPAILVGRRPRIRVGPALGLAMAASVAGFTFYKLGDWSPKAREPRLVSQGASPTADRHPLTEDIPHAAVLWGGERHDTPERLTTYLLMHNQYDGSLSGPEVSPSEASPYFTTVVHDPNP